MKRTEKIEIRVSLDEKETLTKLAKQEGDSVSGLVRGLIDKYMALNAASTKRRLPKWQLAGLFVVAALIGHGLTLIPMHLHKRGHSDVALSPIYSVHGAVENAAFGVNLSQQEATQEFTLKTGADIWLTVKLSLADLDDAGGQIYVAMCEKTEPMSTCAPVYANNFHVERVAPSVVGGATSSGQNIHLFIQEMAKA